MTRHVTPSFVTIGQGQPSAGKALLAVDSKLVLVHKLIPANTIRTTISGDAATRVVKLDRHFASKHLSAPRLSSEARPYAALRLPFCREGSISDVAQYHRKTYSAR
jgi:hypothetical protein